MTWHITEREYFFDIQDAVPGGSNVADEAFVRTYCSTRTDERIKAGRVATADVRRVVAKIAERVPDGDHTSPQWSTRSQPLAVIGRARLKERLKKGLPPIAETRNPRFGLFADKGKLYFWASKALVSEVLGQAVLDGATWRPWVTDLVLHSVPIQGSGAALADPAHPLLCEPLASVLRHVQADASRAAGDERHRALLEVLEPCREALGDPPGWDVIYPRLAEEMGGADDDDQLPDPEPVPPKPPRTVAVRERSESAASPGISLRGGSQEADSESMLEIVRKVAIARVRTVIPGFDDAGLDRWVMVTGYPGLTEPHSSAAHLVGTWAASLANAGGRKPDPVQFGALVRDAVSGLLYADGSSLREGLTDAGELARRCVPFLERNPLGGMFAEDVRSIAGGQNGRPMMRGLLGSVVDFTKWLCEKYSGSAGALHESLCVPVVENESRPYEWLRQLTTFKWMGIATAANFLKDSQVPGLAARGVDPLAAAGFLASWFAKPDIHVTRLMAVVTGRWPSQGDERNVKSLKFGEAVGLFRSAPAPGFSGDYDMAGSRPALRVVADIHDWARAAKTSPLEIDRVLYLIGVTKQTVDGRDVNEPWYPKFEAAVSAALARGVARKS